MTPKKWEKGKDWGWVWGEDDELGNLNELSPELTLKALSKVQEGNVYDLGLAYDRRSYKFVGHSSGEIMSFRTRRACSSILEIRSCPSWRKITR